VPVIVAQAEAYPIDKGEKRGLCFLCISTLSKGLLSLDEGHGPRREEQASRKMGVGISWVSPTRSASASVTTGVRRHRLRVEAEIGWLCRLRHVRLVAGH